MLPLAIWLVLIGYTIAWTGRQNLGISYQPQADGTIKGVGPDGKDARKISFADAVMCKTGVATVTKPPSLPQVPQGTPSQTPPLQPRVMPTPAAPPAYTFVPAPKPPTVPTPHPLPPILGPISQFGQTLWAGLTR
jgi:hypothetical protein